MPRTMVVPFVGGICGGALTVMVLWLAAQALPSDGVAAELEAESQPVLSAIEAIAIVRQVRSDFDSADLRPMYQVLAELCHPEEPDYRATFLFEKWEVTARCTALSESPVWFVTEPDLRVVPYTNAAGRFTR